MEKTDSYAYLKEKKTTYSGIYQYHVMTGGKPCTRYSVRFRDNENKQRRKSGFKTLRDAKAFKRSAELAVENEDYVAPEKAKRTIGEYGAGIVALLEKTGKPSHGRDIESAWRVHVLPKWGGYPLNAVTWSKVQAWVNGLRDGTEPSTKGREESASVILRAFGLLKTIYESANRDGMTKNMPCRDVKLPRKVPAKHVYLTVDQLYALADAAGEHRNLILFLGIMGLRIGEARALRVEDINFENGKIWVGSSISRSNNWEETIPKTDMGRRELVAPPIILDALKEECEGKNGDDFVFTESDGSHLRDLKRTASGWYKRAIEKSGVPSVKIHELRHTAASIAVSSGASVKAIQKMLGHKSASMTLDTYSDLFDEDQRSVADHIQKKLEERNRT